LGERFADVARQFRDLEKKLEPELLFAQQFKVNRTLHEKIDDLDNMIVSRSPSFNLIEERK
jgi:hypothetical protein